MSLPRLLWLAGLLTGSSLAEIEPRVVEPAFTAGEVQGDASLFTVSEEGLEVTWDSSKTNSFFKFPLGLEVTRADRFTFSFELKLSEIAIATTPGKPYTFQIAVGLINSRSASDPEMFRGTGVNPAHGPRNLVEWNYFPDSGFGATVAPTVATASNQIAFSDNHPLPLEVDTTYRFEISFDSFDQTLRTQMAKGLDWPIALKDLVVSEGFADFRVDTLAVSSYSDAGQTSPFTGSIKAKGLIRKLRAVIYNRPTVEIQVDGLGTYATFRTTDRWRYQLEASRDLQTWEARGLPGDGTGEVLHIPLRELSHAQEFYRVRGERIR